MDYLYLFIASLFALSIGQVGSSVESCNKLSECGKGMNSASKNNQVEELCKKTEAAIACFKEHLPDCKIETFTKAFEGTMKQTELKAKEACSQTENDDGHDAAPGTVLSTFLLIGCLLLGKLGLLHTSG